MAKDTDIGYCDSTGNIQMGCDGCELWNRLQGNLACYAGNMTDRYAGRAGWPAKFEKPKIFPERLESIIGWPDLRGLDRPEKPWLNGLPRIVFLNDMGDTFTESLDVNWLAPFLPSLAASPHQFLILTKRAQRLLQFSQEHELPPNVWPGVSITSANKINRLEYLGMVRSGGPKWVSFEPALSSVDWKNWIPKICPDLRWIVVGGLSAKSRATPLKWLRDPLDCRGIQIAGFAKQLGSVTQEDYYLEDDARREWLIDKSDRKKAKILVPSGKPGYYAEWEHRTHGQPAPGSVFEWKPTGKGEDLSEWPEELRIREMPIGPVPKPKADASVSNSSQGTLF